MLNLLVYQINNHYYKIKTNMYNCRNYKEFPLQNRCLNESIVYQCTISSSENPTAKIFYIGSTVSF